MNEQIKKLGRLTSEGDQEAARELGKELLRKGMISIPGEAWIIRRRLTNQKDDGGRTWSWAGSEGWGADPQLYASRIDAVQDLARRRIRFVDPETFQVRDYQIEICKIQYVIVEEEEREAPDGRVVGPARVRHVIDSRGEFREVPRWYREEPGPLTEEELQMMEEFDLQPQEALDPDVPRLQDE